MKKIVCILLSLLSFCVFTSCECEHQGEWVTVTAVSCTAAGMDVLNCDLCGETQSRTISATGHNWVDANCESAKHCSLCNLIEGEALGHNYKTTVIKSATCTTDGNENNLCLNCNETHDSVITKKGHTNTLQSSGIDICSVCNAKTYSTYSVKAVSALYQRLLSPESATISSVYANNYTWENKNSVVVVINVSAKTAGGGTRNTDYVVLFDVQSKKMTFDLQSEVQNKIKSCESRMAVASSARKLELYDELNVYSNQKIEVLRLISYKSTKLVPQNVELITNEAKKASGVFN